MTKELSKKLCEIVGIKPKKIILPQNCDCTCKYWNSPTSPLCERGKNTCPEHIKYVYPNFGQPENFVKLLEIYFRINKLSDVSSIAGILKKIINSAELNCGLKRIIREAEWKYD